MPSDCKYAVDTNPDGLVWCYKKEPRIIRLHKKAGCPYCELWARTIREIAAVLHLKFEVILYPTKQEFIENGAKEKAIELLDGHENLIRSKSFLEVEDPMTARMEILRLISGVDNI